jgi:hypothetical protein
VIIKVGDNKVDIKGDIKDDVRVKPVCLVDGWVEY